MNMAQQNFVSWLDNIPMKCVATVLEDDAKLEFLIQYPLFQPFTDGTAAFQLDLQTLMSDAKKYNWTSVSMVEIDQHFEANGTVDSFIYEECAVIPAVKLSESPLQDISNTVNRRGRERVRPHRSSTKKHCVFCLNNGADASIYLNHRCRNGRGEVTCPTLQTFICPYCAATGSNAHTPKYCPVKPLITPEDCQKMEETCRKNYVLSQYKKERRISERSALNTASKKTRLRV
ncbi:uncharacterized protein LOC128724659 [Anopheles nili]|uniref:uncharacterized protein LOC128724659 n=1 Tax=Anopheles nili TaxID=185578 RepID=UPI00237C17D2|nr:uncharacterized protein LOC128724659 [Anopheles nili]